MCANENEKAAAYATKQLKSQKQNYPTNDLALASANFALKIWRNYLYMENHVRY